MQENLRVLLEELEVVVCMLLSENPGLKSLAR